MSVNDNEVGVKVVYISSFLKFGWRLKLKKQKKKVLVFLLYFS